MAKNDFNNCTFTGALGSDPDIRYTADGKAIAKFSIAVNKTWNGEETVTWVNLVAFSKTAELVGQYLTKGSKILVLCEFNIQQWEKDGQKHSRPEFRVKELQFLGGGRQQEQSQVNQGGGNRQGSGRQQTQGQRQQGQQGRGGYQQGPPEEDIPF